MLQALDDLASSFGFTMQALEHVPSAEGRGQTGIFSLSLQLETDDTVPDTSPQLQDLPFLHLKQVVLGYGETLCPALQGDLEVVIVQPGQPWAGASQVERRNSSTGRWCFWCSV